MYFYNKINIGIDNEYKVLRLSHSLVASFESMAMKASKADGRR
jgi:hypothetical protein